MHYIKCQRKTLMHLRIHMHTKNHILYGRICTVFLQNQLMKYALLDRKYLLKTDSSNAQCTKIVIKIAMKYFQVFVQMSVTST